MNIKRVLPILRAFGQTSPTPFLAQKYDQVLEWDFKKPEIKWFANGKLNITENIFERHMFHRGDQTAIIWEPNDPKEQFVKLTYNELFSKVKQFSNVLLKQGVQRVTALQYTCPWCLNLL